MKSHYDLLGLDPSADVETIKKAFRREIAKYHPDKVTHLGAEFQEMASTRAAELTAAYKVLSDPQAREEYDDALRAGRPSTAPAPPSPSAPPRETVEEPPPTERTTRASPGRSHFDEDRAGKDDIVRRATLIRVRDALRQVIGDCDMPEVRGFDVACIPKSKPVTSLTISQFFNRQVMPIVLARIVATVDAAVATDAFGQAVRARLDAKNKPVVVLLIGNQLASSGELARAVEEARRRSPASHDRIFPVPIDGRDWSAKIPLNAPDAVRALVDRLKSSV